MKAKLLDASQLSKRLKKLINKHESISIAVAWGHLTPVAKTLLRNKSKFESVLFGLDFSASDPDLIDQLVDVPNAFVAKNRHGCFHPKIYYFQTGKSAEAIIGSANFTRGGLGENFEANIYIRGNVNSTVFGEIRNQLAAYKQLHSSITKELAAGYRLQAKAASKQPRPKNPVFPNERDQWKRLNSKLATMSWNDFSERARKDKHHDYARLFSWYGPYKRCLQREAPSWIYRLRSGKALPVFSVARKLQRPNLKATTGGGLVP